MTYPIFLTGSEEYVVASVTADVTLNAQPVVIRINGSDYPATWIGTAGTTRSARTTDAIDFTGWDDDVYRLEVRITDSPEIPLVDAGYIRVRAAAVAPGP